MVIPSVFVVCPRSLVSEPLASRVIVVLPKASRRWPPNMAPILQTRRFVACNGPTLALEVIVRPRQSLEGASHEPLPHRTGAEWESRAANGTVLAR